MYHRAFGKGIRLTDVFLKAWRELSHVVQNTGQIGGFGQAAAAQAVFRPFGCAANMVFDCLHLVILVYVSDILHRHPCVSFFILILQSNFLSVLMLYSVYTGICPINRTLR